MIWMWIAAAAAGLCARSVYERSIFTTDVYELSSPKIKKDRTFVFLSDLHDNQFGEGQRLLLAAIHRIRPDGVLIGGDMMVVKKRAETGAALFLIKELARRYPVFCGNGNHESRMDRDRGRYGDLYDRYLLELRAAGVCYLSDSYAEIGEDIRVSGLNIDRRYYRKFGTVPMGQEYIRCRLGDASGDRYQILLAHSPAFFREYREWGADLTLSGHCHGGTVRLPFLGGLVTPQLEFFRKTCGGIFEEEGRTMIVSRGLGTHSVNVRINNPSQLVVIRLKPADQRRA